MIHTVSYSSNIRSTTMVSYRYLTFIFMFTVPQFYLLSNLSSPAPVNTALSFTSIVLWVVLLIVSNKAKKIIDFNNSTTISISRETITLSLMIVCVFNILATLDRLYVNNTYIYFVFNTVSVAYVYSYLYFLNKFLILCKMETKNVDTTVN